MTKKEWKDEYCKKFGLCEQAGECQCKRELAYIERLLAENRNAEELFSQRLENLLKTARDYIHASSIMSTQDVHITPAEQLRQQANAIERKEQFVKELDTALLALIEKKT